MLRLAHIPDRRLGWRGVWCAGALALLIWGARGHDASAQSSESDSGRGVMIPIRGPIDDVMRDSIERRIDEAVDGGATTLIFELDTPGGLVTSALDICRLIKRQPESIRTIAWINPQAYSAGAMISVACDEIWMTPSSSIGDCAPIMVTPAGGMQELGEAERAKAESPILQEFRDSAARNGYDPLLCRAMVAVGTEVWWIESIDTGERRFVTTEDKQDLLDDVEDADRRWRLVESYDVPGLNEPLPVEQPVDREDTLLTLSQYDAVGFGFARGIAADRAKLAAQIGLAVAPARSERNGWEKFAAWLNSPMVRGVLLVLVFIGAYIEFNSPGLILPGATALVALAIFLGAPYAAGLATFWPIVLLAVGVILLAVEILVIPGFGIAGILGVVLMLAAILGSFIPAEPELPTFSPPNVRSILDGLKTGVLVLSASMLVSITGMVLLAYYLPKTPLATGVVTGNPMEQVLRDDSGTAQPRIGDMGVVTADLRPGGQARFGQALVDVHSEAPYVERGQQVRVQRYDGLRIVVRPVTDDQTGSQSPPAQG